jgi:hypothetical protein
LSYSYEITESLTGTMAGHVTVNCIPAGEAEVVHFEREYAVQLLRMEVETQR